MSRDTDATVAMNALRARFKATYARDRSKAATYARAHAVPKDYPGLEEDLLLEWYRADWAVIKRAIRATTKLQAQYRQPRHNETARQAAARLKKNAALVHEAHEAVVALLRYPL